MAEHNQITDQSKAGAIASCPICGQVTTEILTDKLRRGSGTVYLCNDCDLGFLISAPVDAKTYYDGEYRDAYSHRADGSATHASELFDVYKHYQQSRLDLIRPYLGPEVDILEIGASAGQFLFHLEGSSRRRCAIELDSACCEFMASKLGIDADSNLLSESRFSGQQFDVVCAFQVMEHTTDPVAFLRDIRAAIRPGGIAFVEVPNRHDPLLSVWGISTYQPFFYHSAHLHYFSAKVLRRIAAAAGFASEDISFRFIQDYNLLNHLHWIMNGTPQATCHVGLSGVKFEGRDAEMAHWLTSELAHLNDAYVKKLMAKEKTSNIMMILHHEK